MQSKNHNLPERNVTQFEISVPPDTTMPSPQTLFLASHGGRVVDGLITDFGDYVAECDAFDHGLRLADAADVGLLRVSGVDAAAFLHNQFSTNVSALMPGQGQYSTYNSPKGRMLASLFLWREGLYPLPLAGEDASTNPRPSPTDTPFPKEAGQVNTNAPVFYLLLAADLVETIRKRLSMYVLRAKVTLEDVSASYAFLGLCGAGVTSDAVSIRAQTCLGLNSLPKLHHVQTQNDFTAVALSPTRLLLVLPMETLPEHWLRLSQNALPTGRHLWQRAAILDGIPLITAATSDRLIPQSANWDALGGLDFQKGCYPGQEIIARTRYLGRIKERLYLARCNEDTPFSSATPLYSPAFGEQACGLIVNAVSDRKGQIMLASFQTAAANSPIHVARPDGPTLTLLPLPYELPVDETPNRIKL
ncbi:MAG: hypothetical protein LBI35_09495 [Burkholderiales bacterium]|nr:hypothetical protein [Burkholderiales bacterium]